VCNVLIQAFFLGSDHVVRNPFLGYRLGTSFRPPTLDMTILLLSLDKASDDAKLGPLLDSIRSVTTLELVETIAELRIALRRPNKPSAVLEIDGGISNPDNRDSLQLLIAFVTQGGILVCGGNFSDAHKGLDYLYATEFFSRWGLPWDAGSYLRTTIHLNPRPQTVAGIFFYGLSQSYSVKALSLVNVPAHQALYNPSSSSRIESRVFSPDRFPVDPKETPCAYAQVGRGYFGYVGDMNNEEASIRVIRAMLRLPQSTSPPSLNNPLRDGTQANQDQTDDIRYTDDIRQAGHGELEFGYRQGEEVGIVAFPADGGPPVPVLVPPQYAQLVYGRSRSRSPEVAARATKRAAVSTRKHEQSEALKEQVAISDCRGQPKLNVTGKREISTRRLPCCGCILQTGYRRSWSSAHVSGKPCCRLHEVGNVSCHCTFFNANPLSQKA
jgi:hypothetical protein